MENLGFLNLLLVNPILIFSNFPVQFKNSRFEKATVLIDTGASISVVSQKFAQNFDLMECEGIRIKGVVSHEKISHSVTITFEIAGDQINHNFLVVPSLQRDIIIGSDFLFQHECYINYPQSSLILRGEKLPLYFEEKEALEARHPELYLLHIEPSEEEEEVKIPVYVRQSVRTGTGYMHLPVRVDLKEAHNPSASYHLEFKPKFLRQHPIVGPEILAIPEELNSIIILPLEKGRKIRKGTCVGYLTSYVQAFHINAIDTSVDPNEGKRLKMTQEQIDTLQFAEDLSAEQVQELKQLLSQFADAFTWDPDGITDLGEYKGPFDEPTDDGVRLLVKDHKPVTSRPFKQSLPERQKLRDYLDKFQKAGVISEKAVRTSSPCMILIKPNGGYRLVVDLRKVNQNALHKVHQVLPEVEDIFQILNDFEYMTITDFSHGYFQLPIDSRDKYITGTTSMDKTFEWNRVPQGLATAPFIFQSVIRKVFYTMLYKFIFSYLDDIIVYSKSFREHIVHLTDFLKTLTKVGLKLNPRKCTFATGKAKILGFIISRGGKVEPNPAKIKSVEVMPPPMNTNNNTVNISLLKGFLGCINFYSKFIPNFKETAEPLYAFQRKGASKEWTQKAQKAFETLKGAMMRPPILHTFRQNRKCILECDASDYAIGCVFGQETEEGDKVIIAFLSQLLSSAERNYSTAEKECLALVWSLKRLHTFLEEKTIYVLSDNHAVCSLLKMKFSTNRRLSRWLFELSGYDIIIQYKKGALHYAADCASRLLPLGPVPKKSAEESAEVLLNEIVVEDQDNFRQRIRKAQKLDPELKGVFEKLLTKSIEKGYINIEGILYYRGIRDRNMRIVVPQKLVSEILYLFHDHIVGGHQGKDRTIERIRRTFYWKSMNRDIQNYVSSCITCRQIKSRNQLPYGTMIPHEIPNAPFEKIYFDILGPLVPSKQIKYQYCMVAVRYLTKFIVAAPSTTYTSEQVAKFLCKNIIFRHGTPNTIVWDNHPAHKSAIMEHFNQYMAIHPKFTTAYSSTGNSPAERAIRAIENTLACYVSTSNKDWAIYLDAVIFALNAAVNRVTMLSPFYLVHGRHPRMTEIGIIPSYTSSEFLDELIKAREKAKAYIMLEQEKYRASFNQRHRELQMSIGDFVMLYHPGMDIGNSRKLSAKFRGPYRITKLINPQNVEVESLSPPFGRDIVHVKRVRAITARFERLTDYDPGAVVTSDLNTGQSDRVVSREQAVVQSTSNNPNIQRTRSGRISKPVVRFQNE